MEPEVVITEIRPPQTQPPLILYAAGWYDGPINGLALWHDEIVAFAQHQDYHEVPCAPGVREPLDDEDDAWQPDDGNIYNGMHCYSRSFSLHRRDTQRVHNELVGHFGWARLMNPHHNALGTTYRPEPDVTYEVFNQWSAARGRPPCYEPDGPSLIILPLSAFANARSRDTLPLHIQDQLGRAETEFDQSWTAWRSSTTKYVDSRASSGPSL